MTVKAARVTIFHLSDPKSSRKDNALFRAVGMRPAGVSVAGACWDGGNCPLLFPTSGARLLPLPSGLDCSTSSLTFPWQGSPQPVSLSLALATVVLGHLVASVGPPQHGTTDIWGQIILYVGGGLVPCGVLSSVPGLCTPGASSTLQL